MPDKLPLDDHDLDDLRPDAQRAADAALGRLAAHAAAELPAAGHAPRGAGCGLPRRRPGARRMSFPFTPLLLPEPQAAHFLGVSPSKLRELSIPRRVLGAKRLYDQRDLIEYADALHYEGGGEVDQGEVDRCAADKAFGCA